MLTHQEPLKRETKYMVKEFESKRGLGAKVKLDGAGRIAAVLAAKTAPECILMGEHLKEVNEQVGVVEKLCASLALSEGDWAEKHTTRQGELASLIGKQKQDIVEVTSVELNRIDVESEEKLKVYMLEQTAKYAD
jgi:hypothetical protein